MMSTEIFLFLFKGHVFPSSSRICCCCNGPFVVLPVNQLYPQHGGHGGAGRQQVDLLVAQPELGGVIRGEVAEALPVLDPVLAEVHAAIASLF